MFVHVILVHVVEMAVVQIVHMAVMANCGVPAFRAVPMSVVGMVFFGASGHRPCSSLTLGLLSDTPVQHGNGCEASDAKVHAS
jgi:hypothetical protein